MSLNLNPDHNFINIEKCMGSSLKEHVFPLAPLVHVKSQFHNKMWIKHANKYREVNGKFIKRACLLLRFMNYHLPRVRQLPPACISTLAPRLPFPNGRHYSFCRLCANYACHVICSSCHGCATCANLNHMRESHSLQQLLVDAGIWS